MIRAILLDAGPLGLVTQRSGIAAADGCRRWMEACLRARSSVLVPEIADYEIRRELVRANKHASISRLDMFIRAELGRYLPITTSIMRQAALFWAQARRQGMPTAPDPALDADVILAAQAHLLAQSDVRVVIATTNVGHLSRFVAAELWTSISP